MNKIIEVLTIIFGVIVLIGVVSIFSGTIIFIIWPIAIPAVFPGLVTAGTIAAKLTWVQSVCFTWICGILIKSSQTNNSKGN